jgi:tetratricopeptide (TPR) repeat protein
MRELLAALARDPRRRLRRALAAVLAVAAIGSAVLFLRPSRAAECSGGDERGASVWNLERRARMRGAFLASGRPLAQSTFDRSAALLDTWTSTWQVGFRDACEATRVRGEQSEHLLDLRMQCLSRKLGDASAAIDVLAKGGVEAVDHALDALLALPSVESCADSAGLLADVAPPEDRATELQVSGIRNQLARAKAEDMLGRYRAELELARNAVAMARATKYEPILADALLVLGKTEFQLSEGATAETLRETIRVAASAGAIATFVEGSAVLVSVLTHQAQTLAAASELAGIADGFSRHARVSAEQAILLDQSLGNLEAKLGRPAVAQRRYERAVARAEKDLPDSVVLATALTRLGSALKDAGHYEEAERLEQRAVSVDERLYGKDHPALASALNELAIVYRIENKLVQAKQLYERSMAIFAATFGEGSPDVAASLQNLGSLALDMRDPAAALAYAQRTLDILTKRYGPDGIELAAALSNMGTALHDLGREGEAREALTHAIRICEAAYGPDHIALVNPLNNLAVIADTQHRYDEAAELYTRAMQITRRAYGPDHPDLADFESNIGNVFKHQKRYPEALAAYQRALALAEKSLGRDAPHTGMVLVNLGELDLQIHDYAPALPLFRRALQIFEKEFGKAHIYTSYALIGVGEALVGQGQATEAVSYIERAAAIRKDERDAGLQADVFYARAQAEAALGKTDAAHADAHNAIAAYQAANRDDDAAVVRAWLAKH